MNMFESDDYKKIIRAVIESKGKAKRGLLQRLADFLGVHASLVSQVLAGQKDFTEEQIFSVCEFLGLGKLETDYLLALVKIERAGSKKLKDHYQTEKQRVRKQALQVGERINKERQLTETERAIFYSHWLYSAVHMLTTLDSKVTFEEICQRLNLTPKKARDIIDFLLQIQIVSEQDGKFGATAVSTHIEKQSPFLLKHLSNWRLKAIEASDKITDEELMYSSNFSVSRKDFAVIREEMMQTIQKFQKIVKDSPAEDIAQFNLDLFWIK